VVPGRDRQKPVDALLKAGGILLPEQVVQEDAHVFMPMASAQVNS